MFEWIDLSIEEMAEAYAMACNLPDQMQGNYSGNKIQKKTAGFVGQLAAHKFFVGSEHIDAHDYDLLLGQKRLEVKTATRNIAPRYERNFWCRIAASNDSQLCDYYIFCQTQWQHKAREQKLMHGAWILGFLDVESARNKMHFARKGDVEAGDEFPEKGDCWKIEVINILPPKSLK